MLEFESDSTITERISDESINYDLEYALHLSREQTVKIGSPSEVQEKYLKELEKYLDFK